MYIHMLPMRLIDFLLVRVPGFICGRTQPSQSTEVKAEAEAFVRKLRKKVYRKNQVGSDQNQLISQDIYRVVVN